MMLKLLRCIPPCVLILISICLSGCCAAKPVELPLSRYEFTHPQMGTTFQIVIYAVEEAGAEAAADLAFARIDELNAILSDYIRTSELSKLSDSAGSGQAVEVSEDLWNVMAISDEFARKSGGAFDITVGPVVQLWRWARRNRQMPSQTRLKAAVDAVGYDKVELDANARTIKLTMPNMRLDAGGIGKGYACDEALKILNQRGYYKVMIEGGGGILLGDAPPGRDGWRIGIASLDPQNVPPSKYVILKNAAMSTSGDAWQHVELEGKRYSHIVDAKTGLGLVDHSSVTIIAPTCTLTDVLSTTVAVLGPEKGLAFVDKMEGVAAFIVRKPGDEIEVFESAGVKKLTLDEPK